MFLRILLRLTSVLACAALVVACHSNSTPSTPSTPTTCAPPTVPQDQVNRTVDAAGGTLTIPVSAASGCTWTATSNATFLTVTGGATGSGNGTVTITVAANTGAQRTGTLSVAGTTVTVTQAGAIPCAFTVTPASVNVRSRGESATFTVAATAQTCTWTATSNIPFITITSGATGTGNGTVQVAVAENTGPFRSGTVTIAGQTVTVTQDAAGICVTGISPTTQAFDSNGGTGTVTVTAPDTCGWHVESNADFIIVVPGTRGGGNGSFTYTVTQNSSTAGRQGTVSVGGLILTVTQSGACPATVSPTTISVDGGGHVEPPLVGGPPIPVTLTMTGSCSWTASSDSPDWLRVTPSGTGSAVVNVSMNQNNSGRIRTGTVTIAGLPVSVTQAACVFTLSPTTVTVGSAATSIDFTADGSAGCLYNFNRNTQFLDVPFQSIGYTGTNTIHVGVSQNQTGVSRTDLLQMGGRETSGGLVIMVTATVTQTGTP